MIKQKKQEPGQYFDKVIRESFTALEDAKTNINVAGLGLQALVDAFKADERFIKKLKTNSK
jgi:hypothetical protein